MSIRTRVLAVFATAAVASTGGAMAIILPALDREEGLRLTAYPDAGGVWTICRGETEGVRPGMIKTLEECDNLTISRVKYFYDVAQAAVAPPLSDLQAAGWTLFVYNVGTGNLAKSQALRLANSGQYEAGCRAMMNFYRAGGKDCRIRSNGCYGMIKRREREITACIGKENPWQSSTSSSR